MLLSVIKEYSASVRLKLAVKAQSIEQEITAGSWLKGHQHTAISLEYIIVHGDIYINLWEIYELY